MKAREHSFPLSSWKRQDLAVVATGIALNLTLAGAKWFGSIAGNSKGLLADAVNSSVDAVTGIVVLSVLIIAVRPSDREHPYGHGKAESLGSWMVGLFIILSAIYAATVSIVTIARGGGEIPKMITLWIALGTLVTKETAYRVTIWVGRAAKSPAVTAFAYDHRSDALATLGVIAGIVGARLGLEVLDPIAGLFVSLLILRMGLKVLRTSVRELMDISPDRDLLEAAAAIAAGMPGVQYVSGIRGRRSGRSTIIDLKLEVLSELNIEKGHDIGRQAKRAIMKKIPEVSDVLVHIDPHFHRDERNHRGGY